MSVTLHPGTGLEDVARILWYGRRLGPRAWGPDLPAEDDMAGISEFSSELGELFGLLNSRGIRHMLVGGVAMLRYVEGRNTEDIDLVLSVTALPLMPEISISDRNPDFARGRFKGIGVDLLLTENPVYQIAMDQYAAGCEFGGIKVPCATPNGLIFLKLYALPALYRAGNFQRAILYENDIAMLMQRYKPEIAPLLEAVKPYLATPEHDELTTIVAEITARLARMEKR